MLEGFAGKEANTKKGAMKGMLIWYFLRHVSLMNIKREMKKPFQANLQVISCPHTRARMTKQQQLKLTFALHCLY